MEIDGLHPRRYTELHGIGYVPERVAIPRRWSVEGALQASGRAGERQVKDVKVSFVGASAPIVQGTTFIFVNEPY